MNFKIEEITNQIIQGDSLEVLKKMPDECINSCITSPPYWGLRDYGVRGQLGLEKTPEEYVAKMVKIFREIKRVLKKEGVMFLNLGDSYMSHTGDFSKSGGFQGKQIRENIDAKKAKNLYMPKTHLYKTGLKNKDLIGIPWMIAFALRSDGWYLRQDIIWHKPNPMPESVTDRCTKSHEYIFLLTKSPRYYFDYYAIQEKSIWAEKDYRSKVKGGVKSGGKTATGQYATDKVAYQENGMRNKRSVWTIITKPFKEAHFATFPEELIIPMVNAGCPEFICKKCGMARNIILKNIQKQHSIGATSGQYWKMRNFKGDNTVKNMSVKIGLTDCGCNAGWTPGIILDPFMGAGTTALVAKKLKRNFIGIELNADYIKIAEKRLSQEILI